MAGGVQNDGNKPGGPVVWVMNHDDLEMLLEAIRVCERVVVDLETTGLVEYAWSGGPQNGGVAARIALASFTLPDATVPMGDEWDGKEPTTWVLPLSHPHSPFLGEWREVMKQCMLAMKETHRPIENVNVKFDARWWYRHTGVDVTAQIVFDPQVASHVMDETQPRKLKDRVPQIFGIEGWNDVSFEQPGAAERADLFVLGSYAARDTYWTWRWGVHIRRELYLQDVDEGDEPQFQEEVQAARFGKLCVWVSMPSVASLARIEQRGFRLDVPWVKDHLAQDMEISTKGLIEIAEKTGMPLKDRSIAPTSHWFIQAMANAVDKKLLHVAAMTGGGKPQWSKEVLNRQAMQWAANPDVPDEWNLARIILDTRQASKRAEYERAWIALADREGVIHAKYNVGSVVTGRLSSSEPNLQQVTKKLRPAFIPRPGFVVAALDYSQLELRVAAFLSRSEPMMQAYRDGKDLHRMLAATMTGKPEADISDEERQMAKAGNFGLLYLMAASGLRGYAENSYGVSMTDSQAIAVYRGFFQTWEGIREWHQSTIAKAHRDGYVTSPIGRVRRLPGLYSNNDNMVAFSERAAVNSVVQGFGSDLMMMALASIQGLLPGTTAVKGAFPVNTVHDEGTIEVLASDAEAIVAECQDRMTNLNSYLLKMGCDFDVPIVADATVGTRWALSDISDTWGSAAAA